MSSTVQDNNITLTRGDTLRLEVGLEVDGQQYVPEDGDVIKFTVKRRKMDSEMSKYIDEDPLIEKVIPNDTLILHIQPGDTKPLRFGDYDYNVEITYPNGDNYTFIEGRLKITKETN